MTDLFFSPSSGGFYSRALHDQAIPDDAVKISAAVHRRLMAAQAAGSTIGVAKGRPVAVAPPVQSDVHGMLTARIRREAARRIEAISPIWRQINDQRAPSPEGQIRFARIDAVRAASNQIAAVVMELPSDTLTTLAIEQHPLWPEFD
ncbi:hypothetical protein [Sphingobium yanoikuyae]|uniref:hypothetical protein n=1 Tax=Sphingobium yanoikuyae TaxID=13690 RepID=UPI002FDC91EF